MEAAQREPQNIVACVAGPQTLGHVFTKFRSRAQGIGSNPE